MQRSLSRSGAGAGLVAALILVVLGGGVALAHARVVSSVPADGSRVAVPPARILLRFSEDLAPAGSTATATHLDGTPVDGQDAAVDTADRHVLSVGAPNLTPGGYLVHWHAVAAAGGGVTEGSIAFTVVAEGGGEATPVTAPVAVTPPAPAAARPAPPSSATRSRPLSGGAALPGAGQPHWPGASLLLGAMLLAALGATLRRRAA